MGNKIDQLAPRIHSSRRMSRFAIETVTKDKSGKILDYYYRWVPGPVGHTDDQQTSGVVANTQPSAA